LSIISNERVRKLKERFKSNSLLSKKRSEILEMNCYRKERLSSSSSSSSSDQSTRFSSKAKLYEKSFNWIRIGKGECEIIETNRTRNIFTRKFCINEFCFRRNFSSILAFKKLSNSSCS
jgi:hypothetical protein